MPGLRIGRLARRMALSVFTLMWAKLCRSLISGRGRPNFTNGWSISEPAAPAQEA